MGPLGVIFLANCNLPDSKDSLRNEFIATLNSAAFLQMVLLFTLPGAGGRGFPGFGGGLEGGGGGGLYPP